MIKKVFFSLILGFVVLFFFIQRDPWVQQEIARAYINAFQQALHCSVQAQVSHVSFFSPMIELVNIRVGPSDGSDRWYWCCNRFQTGFSWTNFFSYGAVDMWLSLDKLDVHSQIKNKNLALMEHIRELTKSPEIPLPLFLKKLNIRRGTVNIVDTDSSNNVLYTWQSESKKIDNCFKTIIYIKDGSCAIKDQTVCEHCSGRILVRSQDIEGKSCLSAHVDCRFTIPQLEHNQCFVTGTWRKDSGAFIVKNLDQSLYINPLRITVRDMVPWISLNGQMPCSLLCTLAKPYTTTQLPLRGTLLCNFTGALQYDHPFECRLACKHAGYGILFDEGNCKILIRKHGKSVTSSCITAIPGIGTLISKGIWHIDTRKGTYVIKNYSPLTSLYVPYWQVNKHNLCVTMNIDPLNNIQVALDCVLTNSLRTKSAECHGKISLNKNDLYLEGKVQDYTLSAHAQTDTFPYLDTVRCINNKNKIESLLTCSKDKPLQLTGFVEVPFLRALVQQGLNYDMQGEGQLQIKATCEAERIKAHAHLNHGTIRLPQTYNFINGFDCDIAYDTATQGLTLSQLQCTLHKGILRIPHATVYFDARGKLLFAHVPVLVDACLLTFKQDLFALMSGNILFTKTATSPAVVKGHIFIDRAQFKENLFSSVLQTRLAQSTSSLFTLPGTIMSDLVIETKEPIRVDTPLLQANAKARFILKKNIFEPEIVGEVTVLSGMLKFPYKPMYISKGSISFIPEQMYNPTISLMAKNTIKQFNVNLQVTGTLADHQVIMDASPPLTEEQIVALLWVGSQEDSLNAVMPALVMQNIKHLIIGSEQTAMLKNILKPLPKPFNIHLIPRFSDQSGRGGLRGAVEIDVNDRWRALIQQNFDLTEDTRVELEYQLSDDITMRAIRDERRDIGGEVEMRWKF